MSDMTAEQASSIFRTELASILPQDRDAWLDRLWGLGAIPEDDSALPRGCVPYLPCPVGTVLAALEQAEVTSSDVFVDVGSGAGRVVLLASMLTGATCIGLELQSALVATSRERATALELARTQFVAGDAADSLRLITSGTVFFLYCPFGDDRVQRVLADLETIARTHPIRICCVQMPAFERPWLTRLPARSAELDVYRTTLAHDAEHDPGPRLRAE